MKTAYELAMERLEKASGPTRKLSDDQKARIGDIDKVYEARIAETRLSYEARIRAAQSREEYDGLLSEQADKVASLEEQREREKEKIWNDQ